MNQTQTRTPAQISNVPTQETSIEFFKENAYKELTLAYHNARTLIAESDTITIQYYIEEQAFVQTITTVRNGDTIRATTLGDIQVQTTKNHPLIETSNIVNVIELKQWTETDEMREAHGDTEDIIKACLATGMYAPHLHIATTKIVKAEKDRLAKMEVVI